MIEAGDEAKRALGVAIKNHTQLKEQIKQLEITNKDYQGKLKALQAEKRSLQSNISALGQTETLCLCSSHFFIYSTIRIIEAINILFVF